jgi:hypothetical protein
VKATDLVRRIEFRYLHADMSTPLLATRSVIGAKARRMSFFLTTAQVLAHTKTVTRRDAGKWTTLKAGDKIVAIEKGQGLKVGQGHTEELLRPGGCLALYGRSQWGQSAEASPALRRWSPSFQWRLCGRPAHRADGKTDSCEYSLWGWDIEDLHLTTKHHRPTWQCQQLLELPAAMRRWSPAAVPGTYPVDPALVAEIRARYL